jgi:hypothetical protein
MTFLTLIGKMDHMKARNVGAQIGAVNDRKPILDAQLVK